MVACSRRDCSRMLPSTRRSDSGSEDSRRSQADSSRGSCGPQLEAQAGEGGGALLGRRQPAALGLLQAGVGQGAGDPLTQLLGQPVIARVVAAAGVGGHGQDQQRDRLRPLPDRHHQDAASLVAVTVRRPPVAAAAGARRSPRRPAAGRRPRPATARAPPTTSRAGTRTRERSRRRRPRSSTTHSSASTGTAATAACSNTRSGASERVRRTVVSSSRRAACSRRRKSLMSWTWYNRPDRGVARRRRQRAAAAPSDPSPRRDRESERSARPVADPASRRRPNGRRDRPRSRAVKWVASTLGRNLRERRACPRSPARMPPHRSHPRSARRSRPARRRWHCDAARLPVRNWSRGLGRTYTFRCQNWQALQCIWKVLVDDLAATIALRCRHVHETSSCTGAHRDGAGAVAGGPALGQPKQDHTNYDEAKVGGYTLPPLLTTRATASRCGPPPQWNRRSGVRRSWRCTRITCTVTRPAKLPKDLTLHGGRGGSARRWAGTAHRKQIEVRFSKQARRAGDAPAAVHAGGGQGAGAGVPGAALQRQLGHRRRSRACACTRPGTARRRSG